MNGEFPKAARASLARQAAGEVHPTADVLNGLVEHALTAGEAEQVRVHLAGCAGCREIVFLASGAAEEPTVAPAAAPARTWRGLRWAVPAVALVAIVSAVWVEHQSNAKKSTSTAVATTRAPEQPVASVPEASSRELTESSRPLRPSQPYAKQLNESNQQVPAITTKPLTTDEMLMAAAKGDSSGVAMKSGLSAHAKPQPAAPKTSLSTNQEESADDAVQRSLSKAAPLPRSSFREDEAALGAVPGTASMSAASAIRLRSLWRITQDGQLERSYGGDTWTPVLVDNSVKFHVVSVVRNNVWAGGDGGALFRSRDGGVTWSKVALGSGDQVETGGITAIRFATAQQGTIVTDSGSRWTTADGGETWNKT